MTSPIGSPKVATTASIILLTYNQEQFVEEAFLSLLNQDIDNLEIVVSDDCSSDATWEIMQAVAKDYQGPKKIILSCNPINVGIVDNYAAAVKLSSGNLIFMAAGDDISLSDRCSKSIQFWNDTQMQYDLVATDAFDMAYDGKILGEKHNSELEIVTIEDWFKERPYFFGATHMVTRKLLNLAPISNQLPYEDQCLVFRAMLMGGVARLPIALVCHRRGGLTQKIGFKFGGRRAEVIRDMSREIAELRQFSSDAAVLKKTPLVESFISQKLAYCSAILEVFKSPGSIKAFKKFWSSPDVSARDKQRYSRYYFFYPVLVIAHAIRDSIRTLRLR